MPKKEPLYPHVPKGKMPSKTYEPKKIGPAWAVEIASRKKETAALLKQAAEDAESENYESALWRAVDAAGLMSFFVERTAIGMPLSPTGRGFFISKK